MSVVVPLAALGLLVTPADARPPRVDQIPNGDVHECLNCHPRPNGGGGLNRFGQQVEQNLIGSGPTATVDWPPLAPLDADSDGLTNGEELADPDGDGVPDDGPVSNPGDPDDPGDGSEPTEPTDSGDGGGVIAPPEPRGCDSRGGVPAAGLSLGLGLLLLRRRR